ncbi:MAG: uroporphyrinogen-III C-methyltransferase [Gammaproteobacteria bacterium]|nr:uroporphyrinogen-III C-methyltransferase [Gammaproteobacteria bacterium]
MSEIDTSKTRAADQTRPKSTTRGGGAVFLFFCLLIVAAATAAAGWYFWEQLQILQGDYETRTASNTAAINRVDAGVRTMNEQFATQETFEEFANRGARVQLQIEEQLTNIEQRLATLQKMNAGGKQEWQRAEVRHLLNIANDELQLRHNIENALYALRAADNRLRELGDPTLQAVRGQIAREILSLETLPRIDITGMALTLTSLSNIVSDLPLRSRVKIADLPQVNSDDADAAEESVWTRLQAAIDRVFTSLVTVRRDEDVKPLLSPGEEFFLYRNLELKIESTRLALLAHDADNFRVGVAATYTWLEQFFDINHPAVQGFLSELDKMSQAQLSPELPSISGSLELLRQRNDAEGEGQ